MDNEILDTLTGDVSSLEEIDGDLLADGVVDSDGDLEIPERYVDDDYNKLHNRPAINGHELIGDQSSQDLEIDSALQRELDVLLTVGGVKSGDVYLQGTKLEQILRDLFSPIMYPTLINPSCSVSTPGGKLLEKGTVYNTTATVSFNRGTINPAYGTSGYRTGPAQSYSINGGPEQASNSFFVSITEQDNQLVATVKFSEGEQPKDSVGNDYDQPYPAGQVSSSTPLTYEYVYALWANTGNIQAVTKQALVSKTARQKEFTFPAQTAINPEIFDVPGDWTVTAVEVFNTLAQTWENCAHEFDTSTTIHYDAGANPVEYTRYTDNRGYAAGTRKIRIKWT